MFRSNGSNGKKRKRICNLLYCRSVRMGEAATAASPGYGLVWVYGMGCMSCMGLYGLVRVWSLETIRRSWWRPSGLLLVVHFMHQVIAVTAKRAPWLRPPLFTQDGGWIAGGRTGWEKAWFTKSQSTEHLGSAPNSYFMILKPILLINENQRFAYMYLHIYM
ncbi:hypothetical protein K449DRAFT_89595 [Hypoxylon sp. EC38]|nr:hypothetical protein K449DRAFT_89595 [Hypoxylon sp. EC38]